MNFFVFSKFNALPKPFFGYRKNTFCVFATHYCNIKREKYQAFLSGFLIFFLVLYIFFLFREYIRLQNSPKIFLWTIISTFYFLDKAIQRLYNQNMKCFRTIFDNRRIAFG